MIAIIIIIIIMIIIFFELNFQLLHFCLPLYFYAFILLVPDVVVVSTDLAERKGTDRWICIPLLTPPPPSLQKKFFIVLVM